MRLNNLLRNGMGMLLIGGTLNAAVEFSPKSALKSNYQVLYNQTPGKTDTFSGMFSEGEAYGRLRWNSFYKWWEEQSSTQDEHFITALGGSLIYKTATLSDVDLTGGLYYSRAFFDHEKDPVGQLKAGNDLVSRFDYTNTGSKSMGVLGQAYLRYSGLPKTKIRIGRQLVETFYTKSNDTKMIPNTFDGIVIDNKSIPATAIRAAYLTAQKLRSHTKTHSVLMYGDANATAALKPEWSENDDSAMHKGLTYTALRDAGVDRDAPLITADLHNRALHDLKVDLSFYMVPELLSQVMTELNYKIKKGDMTFMPGVRYIRQIDDKAGEIGGAAYDTDTTGYDDPDSLDAQMIAARLVAKYQNYRFNLGYTNILDEADLITPWRGFPTAGYTRSMARYNWKANTKSYRLEVVRNGNAKGIYRDLFVQASILHIDADEDKKDYDQDYYYVGFVQNIPSLTQMQWRLRLGYTDTEKTDADDLDARFEVNYLF